MDRLQVLVSRQEKEAFRQMAKREGLSLSAWLREAGLRRHG
jgi:Mobilization protein NikA